MMTYPNQKHITIKRELPDFSKDKYLAIKQDNLYKAMKELNLNELRTYLYLANNDNDFLLWLSPAYIEKEFGLIGNIFDKGIPGLIKKGYITKQGIGNEYIFHESI